MDRRIIPGAADAGWAGIPGTADIGMSSRDLKAEEKSGLKEYKIALDGIAVVVNSKNIAKDLTVEQLQKIYKGEISTLKFQSIK